MKKLTALLKKMAYRAFIAVWCAARPLLTWLNRHSDSYCPVCEKPSRFVIRREGATPEDSGIGEVCPICFSRPRHRLSWLYMCKKTNLLDGVPKRLLHLAPEMEFTRRFRAIPGVIYLSADLDHPGAMRRIDLTDIDWPAESFDLIYCSHMLEHIPQDRKAMGELYRVLDKNGWVLVQVPLSMEHSTQENLAITDPKERERLYGQWDHVRLYGKDIVDRLRDTGFAVSVVLGSDILTPEECRRMNIAPGELLFSCNKTPQADAA